MCVLAGVIVQKPKGREGERYDIKSFLSTLLLLLQGLEDPCDSLGKSLSVLCGGSLDVPLTVTNVVKHEGLSELLGGHGVHKILFVGENKEGNTRQLVFFQKRVQLDSSLLNTTAIGTVDDVNL